RHPGRSAESAIKAARRAEAGVERDFRCTAGGASQQFLRLLELADLEVVLDAGADRSAKLAGQLHWRPRHARRELTCAHRRRFGPALRDVAFRLSQPECLAVIHSASPLLWRDAGPPFP